jgi:hypothetical protein
MVPTDGDEAAKAKALDSAVISPIELRRWLTGVEQDSPHSEQ